jgi:tRNA (cytidine/uridine-2'-O-)-methyltransferase
MPPVCPSSLAFPAVSAHPPATPHRPRVTVVLVEPQIPPNTGNIARLCAAADCHLILLGALGFTLDDAHLRRAGLDYWEHVSWEHKKDADGFLASLPPRAVHLLSARATLPYTQIPIADGDYLVFGKETTGLAPAVLDRFPGQCYAIPIVEPGVRSLNLSSAVAIVLYDALRRLRHF